MFKKLPSRKLDNSGPLSLGVIEASKNRKYSTHGTTFSLFSLSFLSPENGISENFREDVKMKLVKYTAAKMAQIYKPANQSR